MPTVSSPRRLASSNARSRFSEFPLVDSPTAMSVRRPNAAICLAKTTSTPMSLHSAVTTDVSLASPSAGSGRASPPGFRNRVASSWASVALPPLPKASSRPPPANRAAASRAQDIRRALSRVLTSRRSSVISRAFATVDRRTSSRTAGRSLAPEYRNGYSDSIASGWPSCGGIRGVAPPGWLRVIWSSPHGVAPEAPGTPGDRDRFPGVHQDRVPHARVDQRDADLFLAVAGLDHGEVVVEQPDDCYRDGRVRAGDAHLVVTLGYAHATTSGARRPGCSKNTCTSSQST